MDLGANKDIQVLQMTNQILATENAVLQARLAIAESEVQHANGNDGDGPSKSESPKNDSGKGE